MNLQTSGSVFVIEIQQYYFLAFYMFLLKNLYGKLKFHYDHTKMDNTDRKKQRGKVLAPHIFHAKEEDLMKILCYVCCFEYAKEKRKASSFFSFSSFSQCCFKQLHLCTFSLRSLFLTHHINPWRERGFTQNHK